MSFVFKILMIVVVVYGKIMYTKNNKNETILHIGVFLELKAEIGRDPGPS